MSAPIARLLLFGASGDLAGRFLLPALAALHAAGRVPGDLQVVGAAREQWTDEQFRDHAAERLDEHAPDVPAAARAATVRALRYRPVDFDDRRSVESLVHGTSDGPVAAYLALPSGIFEAAVTALDRVGLPPGSRIVVEKPFGEDLEGAVRLNALLAEFAGEAGEDAIFRVDHVLAMATTQNLLGLRFANRVLDPVWNSRHIARVELLWEETLTLEGRAGYYDRAGALKDVLQNHVLQVLALIAMEPPASLGERDVRDAKLGALRAIRDPTPDEVPLHTRRARYTAGRIGERQVPSYVDEKGVDADRRTETFAEVVLRLDTPRWSGTPFVLRAGKALGRRRKGVVVRFRPLSGLPFGDAAGIAGNELWIGIEGPEDIGLCLSGSAPGSPPELAPLTLTAPPPASDLPAYGRVLLDVLTGGRGLSVGPEEAEQAWRAMAPVLQAWDAGRVPLEEYPAGSSGPTGQGRAEVESTTPESR